jgi:hypothetical protein
MFGEKVVALKRNRAILCVVSNATNNGATKMTKYTCVSIGFGPLRITERNAETSEKAADAHASALHTAYWAEAWRQGEDRHGSYSEYTVRAGSKVHSTVRVYAQYAH